MIEQDKVFAKCAWRLIPFMMLLYVANYLDRVNVGFAALTMNKEGVQKLRLQRVNAEAGLISDRKRPLFPCISNLPRSST